jgi:hypothetical protein
MTTVLQSISIELPSSNHTHHKLIALLVHKTLTLHIFLRDKLSVSDFTGLRTWVTANKLQQRRGSYVYLIELIM